jgi:hypothetical protein
MELTPLRCAGNIGVDRERVHKRLGVGIIRVPSGQKKYTKPTLGWRGCRELERLKITLFRVCGKVRDGGLAVDAEHNGRCRSPGGQNKTLNIEIYFHGLVVVAFERQDEKNASADVGAWELLPQMATSSAENVSVRAPPSSETSSCETGCAGRGSSFSSL